MKVGGQSVTAPSGDFIAIPRDPQPLVFWARCLPDMDSFHALCPEPKPPGKLTKEGFIPDPKDKGYGELLANYLKQKIAYIIVQSLTPSQIEWDTVVLDNPRTWTNWEKDLKNAGMTQTEINLVTNMVMAVNYLDESKIAQARESFLHGQALESKLSLSQSTAPESSPSGEPAEEPESCPQE